MSHASRRGGPDDRPGGRGQVRIAGLSVLAVVALGLTATLGTLSLALAPAEDDSVSVVNVDVAVTEDAVTVSHHGGDTLDPDDLRVEIDGDETDLTLDGFDADDSFTAGDRLERAVTLAGDEVLVTVVHEPSGMRLAESRHTV